MRLDSNLNCNSMPENNAPNVSGRKDLPLPRGAYSRIARRVRPTVTPEAVRSVYLGRSKSARISAAIERFKKELEQAVA